VTAAARALAVLARAPSSPGGKTRLAAGVGRAAATRLQRAFLDDVLAATAAVAAARALHLDGALDGPAPPGVTVRAQAAGDLGARMAAALDAERAAGADAVVLVGADSPTMPPAEVERAFAALEAGAELVLGPAADGGYWLVGARAPVPEAFADLPWSTPALLARTLERLFGRGRRVALVGWWYDVDTAEDLALLGAHLAVLPAEVAPATRRVLADLETLQVR
jgi:rSAM/selenodomain-associated transferase 1